MEEGPNRPKPQPLKLDSKKTAVLVLDLSTRCEDPKEVCFQLMAPLAEFLDRTRQSAVPILYTISAAGRGTPLGEVAEPLKRRATEPVLYPDAFDKFIGGELRDKLSQLECRSLVIVGSATNFAGALHRHDCGTHLSLQCRHSSGWSQCQTALRARVCDSPADDFAGFRP
jgi:hypothetical protein